MRYQLAGKRYDDNVQLTRYRRGLFGHGWRITEPPGANLHITNNDGGEITIAGLDPATLNSVGVARAPQSSRFTDGFWAPPGTYTASVGGSPLFDPAAVEVTIAADRRAKPIVLNRSIKAGVADEANRQIRGRIDFCAAQHSFQPDADATVPTFASCPFRYDSPYTITDKPQWTVNRYPATSLHIETDGTLTVHTDTPGSATIHYRWTTDILEPRRWTTDTATEPITVGGQLALKQNAIVWSET